MQGRIACFGCVHTYRTERSLATDTFPILSYRSGAIQAYHWSVHDANAFDSISFAGNFYIDRSYLDTNSCGSIARKTRPTAKSNKNPRCRHRQSN